MPSRADDKRAIDGVGVHAGLVIVVHRDERPVRHHARDAHGVRIGGCWGGPRDEVFDCRGVEELDVGEREYLGQQRRREECL